MLKSVLCVSVLLASANGETPESPNAAVETAARQFRIQTYETYRLNRNIYNDRRAAGDELLEAWRHSGMPDDRREEVIHWFRLSQSTGAHQPLPTVPELPVVEIPVVQNQPDKSIGQLSNFSTSSAPGTVTIEPAGSEVNKFAAGTTAPQVDPSNEGASNDRPASASNVLKGVGRALFRSTGTMVGG